MNTTTLSAQPLNKTVEAGQQLPSLWRRMFDAWVGSYESRISADGKVWFVGL